MIESYKEYLALPKAMTLEKMQELHEAMISEIGSDSDAVELYEELLATAGRYAAIRAGWPISAVRKKWIRTPGVLPVTTL